MNPERSECPVCGGEEWTTGQQELREGKMYYEFLCRECQSAGWEWHADLQEIVDGKAAGIGGKDAA